jgi:hypothetical protein
VRQFLIRHRRPVVLLVIALLVTAFVLLFIAGHGAVSGGSS